MQRTFILGDKWLYYKIFTGRKTADDILVNLFGPLAQKMINQALIKKWFFVRYGTPEFHIRIRFEIAKTENLGTVIDLLHHELKGYFENELIWGIQTDTYARELNRYGQKSIELSEELFFLDSKLILTFLSWRNLENPDELRWLFSLKLLDFYINSFGFDLKRKIKLFNRLKTNYGFEFNMSRSLKKQLDKKYRENYKKIESFLIANNKKEVQLINGLFIENKSQIKKLIEKGLFANGKDNQDQVVESYLHMTMNRVFHSKNRQHEMVCYDFLYRFYSSKLARIKHQKRA
ncbi:thiopeptide-type bacteriocin biosynthesis protein [Flagellimonas onchidii]|uniref:thiopeptide-type bacteriocin biosynthesis protein n=1 Tax=Flagellimonas onchidii TaxID=2562684 RepID=UPI0010A5D5B7|nr:thiopeptide-type bacteriocin biosynthesis protein [Allomuricauda onchidii]